MSFFDLPRQKIMKQSNSRQTTKVMEHNVLPIRKRKIEEQFEHDIESKNSSNPDQSVSSSNKKKKSSAILNAALSLVDASDSKAKHKMKHEFEKFPETLMKILSSGKHNDSVCWVDGVDLFFFVDSNKFTEEVLPAYFKKTKFSSFTRRLSRWGFRQVKGGPHSGCFFHTFFRRENKELCKKIKPPSGLASELASGRHNNVMGPPLKTTPLFMNWKGHDKAMDLHSTHNLPTLNHPTSAPKQSTVAELFNIARLNSNLVDHSGAGLYSRFLNNSATSQVNIKEKICDVQNTHTEYQNILQNRNRMVRNLISRAASRENYTRRREFLMSQEMIQSKLKGSPGPVPYLFGSGQQLTGVANSHVMLKKTPIQFPCEKAAHHNKLELILGRSRSSSANDAPLPPEKDTAEVLRRAVQVLYNS